MSAFNPWDGPTLISVKVSDLALASPAFQEYVGSYFTRVIWGHADVYAAFVDTSGASGRGNAPYLDDPWLTSELQKVAQGWPSIVRCTRSR